MSISNNTNIINPATRYFEWEGSARKGGFISYWDKEAKERAKIAFPFRFIVLDRLAQVGGGIGSGKDYQGFWSNAVRDTRFEPFTVKSKLGIYAEGLWKEIKDKHTSFVTGLYIAYRDDENVLQLAHLALQGAGNSAWIDFTKTHRDIHAGVFSITGSFLNDTGEIHFNSPVFEWADNRSDETTEAAVEMDREILQPYLKAYFGRAIEDSSLTARTGIDENDPSYYPLTEPEDMPDDIKDAQATNNDDIPW